jgi:hypothetical protein
MTKFKIGDRVRHVIPNYWLSGNPTGTVVSVAEPRGPGGLALYGVEVDGDTFPEPWKQREKELVVAPETQEVPDSEIWSMIYDLRGTRPCRACGATAHWAVCNLEGPDSVPVVRGYACGRHLHSVLDTMDWHTDCVQVYDLSVLVHTS